MFHEVNSVKLSLIFTIWQASTYSHIQNMGYFVHLTLDQVTLTLLKVIYLNITERP